MHKHGNLERRRWPHIAGCLGPPLGNAAGEGTRDKRGSPTRSSVGALCQIKKMGTLTSCSSFLQCSHQFRVVFGPSAPSFLTACPRVGLNLSLPPPRYPPLPSSPRTLNYSKNIQRERPKRVRNAFVLRISSGIQGACTIS